jgi:3-phosphoshikimate 1-carboxyvinyltransferase
MLAALSDGRSVVRDILDSADVRSTAAVLRALGVDIPDIAPTMVVDGVGLRGLRAPATTLDCGNSGTTTRLMAGIVAGYPFASTFVGDQSLSRRPMRRLAKPLEAMGARFDFPPHGGLPMTVHGGTLRSHGFMNETGSAQVKSAALLAGLVGQVQVVVTEPRTSRDHTERMLVARGMSVRTTRNGVVFTPGEHLEACDTDVPGDPSSAAFFAALAALSSSGEITLERLCRNPTRLGFFKVLSDMGVPMKEDRLPASGGEDMTTIHVRPGELRGVRVDESRVPSMIDELPLLACLGARAVGETLITGAEELRVKESDRIAAVVRNLRAIGVDAEELPDGMRIVGGTHPLRGHVDTHGDHRLAMSFGVLGALPDNDVEIDDPACVAVSYPRFWDDLRRIIS